MLKQMAKDIYLFILKYICPICYKTRLTQTPITLKYIFWQKVLGFNRSVYWPVHFTSKVSNPYNIYAGIDTSPGYMPGCYIQGMGRVYIGDYTQIAANVGIISSNHDVYDTRKHCLSEVRIGKYCWIGINSTILPNVKLGDWTITGAGSVVTKSFVNGYCIIAGNPAKIIKRLDKNKCIPFYNEHEYNGYIKRDAFQQNIKKYTDIEIENDNNS